MPSTSVCLFRAVAVLRHAGAAGRQTGLDRPFQRHGLHRLEDQQTGGFTIENGATRANGVGSHACFDGEFRGHTFRDLELKVDVMTRPNSNGGVDGGREGPGWANTGAGCTIALQAHDPNSTVYCKNIRVKPLD